MISTIGLSFLNILSLETWILLLTVVVLIRLYIHTKWQVLKKLNIPHEPPTLLGLGNLKELMKNPDCLITQDAKLMKKFGRIYGTYTGLQPRITIGDPEVLKHVYIKESGAFHARQGTLTRINGKEINSALTMVSGSQWKRIRNTLSPALSTAKLKNMFYMFDEHSDRLVEKVQQLVKEENNRFEAKEVFGKLSMDIICSSSFGIDVNSLLQKEEPELVRVSRDLFGADFFGVVIFFMLMVCPPLERLAQKVNFSVMLSNETRRYYNHLIDTVIREKKAKGNTRADLIQAMLNFEISEEEAQKEDVKGLTRTEIVGNSMLLLMVGYLSTAMTMAFLAYSITVDHEVQEKVYQEIEDSIEEQGGLTYEGVNGLKYLDMCLKETLRMYSPVPRNSRYTEVDVTIKGIHVPAGTHVDIPVHALHYDEEYWDEPNKFKPERFEDMSKIDPMVYQPFGNGPRNCIGMRFVLLEVKMAIGKLLHNFKLVPCDETPKPPLTLVHRGSVQPFDDLFLTAIPRDHVCSLPTKEE